MLRIVLGKLYDGAALLPGKIDERLRRIVAVVNGGLTGANLAPGYKLPATAFRERSSLFSLCCRVANLQTVDGAVDTVYAVLPPVPFACQVVALDYIGFSVKLPLVVRRFPAGADLYGAGPSDLELEVLGGDLDVAFPSYPVASVGYYAGKGARRTRAYVTAGGDLDAGDLLALVTGTEFPTYAKRGHLIAWFKAPFLE